MQPWPRTWGKTAIISKARTGIAEKHGPRGAAAFLPHQLRIIIQSRAIACRAPRTPWPDGSPNHQRSPPPPAEICLRTVC